MATLLSVVVAVYRHRALHVLRDAGRVQVDRGHVHHVQGQDGRTARGVGRRERVEGRAGESGDAGLAGILRIQALGVEYRHDSPQLGLLLRVRNTSRTEPGFRDEEHALEAFQGCGMDLEHEVAFQKFCSGFFMLDAQEENLMRIAWEAALEAQQQIQHERNEKERLARGQGSISGVRTVPKLRE